MSENEMQDPSGGMMDEGPFWYRLELTNGTSRLIETSWDEDEMQDVVLERRTAIPVTRQAVMLMGPPAPPGQPREVRLVLGVEADPLLEAVGEFYYLSPHTVVSWSRIQEDSETWGQLKPAVTGEGIVRPPRGIQLPGGPR